MSIEHDWSKTGFVNLYLHAAKVRHADLSKFFQKYASFLESGGDLPLPLHGIDADPAIQAASELLDFLGRAAMYLNEGDRYNGFKRNLLIDAEPPD